MEDRPDFQSQDRLQGAFLDTQWWVVFEDKRRRRSRWWDIITRPGFKHCWAYTRHPNMEGWLAIDNTTGGTQMRFYPDQTLIDHDFTDMSEVIHAEGGIVLPANALMNEDYLPRFMPLTCVELIRQLLGIRERLVITPFQLYKYIVKNRLNMFEYNRILSISHPRRNHVKSI